MRTANLVVTALGLGAAAVAGWIAWKGRRLPIHPQPPTGTRSRHHLLDAARTFAAAVTAGAIAGLLVLGFGGRLVMRILAASSGNSAQGRLTEAGERVGEISTGGTIAFLTFIGLGGGFITAVAYLAARPLLPDHAGRAGLITAVIATGTLGVSNPVSPDNADFAILSPLPLAVFLLLATAGLFATTFTALAARFEQISASDAPLPQRLSTMAALPLSLVVPPFTFAFAVYVTIRSLVTRKPRPALGTLSPRVARATVALATLITAAISARAISQIV